MKYGQEHASPRDLALYVMDALDAGSKSVVEGHVMGCAECADALAREACLEAALEHVAAQQHEHRAIVVPMRRGEKAPVAIAPRRAWPHRAAGGVAGALAAAAAIV